MSRFMVVLSAGGHKEGVPTEVERIKSPCSSFCGTGQGSMMKGEIWPPTHASTTPLTTVPGGSVRLAA